jgi:hypothetical protein
VTISRDAGEATTCTGCVSVEDAPGYVTGWISGPTCCSYFPATVTATRVGDATPTATIVATGYYSLQLPPGDYILKVEADGYVTQWWYASSTEAGATPLSVTSNSYQSLVDFYLVPPRQPLTITGLSWSDVYQDQGTYLWAYGSGFLYGDVTGLTFSSTNDVTVSLDTVYSDTEALLVVRPAVTAALGSRDVSVTRDDGQISTCTACLTVHRGDPYVFSTSPPVVREGTRTLTFSGQFLQRVTRVTTSSRKVKVKSFTNKADGTVSVRVVIDGGARKTYTLTFTRDDGVTFTADFSVRG